MKNQSLGFRSFMHAAGVFAYVVAVVLLLSNASKIFGEVDTILIPMFMLTLFVVSATVTGLLVLGKPVLLYMNGLKKEAMTFLFSTVGWLVMILVLLATAMFALRA